MATALFPRQRAWFRSWRNKKHLRPMANRCRRLYEEPLEQRTVLSAVTPFATVLDADYTGDGVVDADDINVMSCWIGPEGSSNIFHPQMDLNQDGKLSRDDVTQLTRSLRTTAGDVDYDGDFDTTDINKLFVKNEFEDDMERNSTWLTGDVDGNLEFDTADLIYMFQHSVFEPDGDINGDGRVDVKDIDIANCWIGASGGDCWLYADEIDVNRDGTADREDVNFLIRLVGTTPGDSNLDGMFGTEDLVTIFAGGKYETGEKATWETGDFNGDGKCTHDDLVVAFDQSIYGLDAADVDVVFAANVP